jgi:hypothetical protein
MSKKEKEVLYVKKRARENYLSTNRPKQNLLSPVLQTPLTIINLNKFSHP